MVQDTRRAATHRALGIAVLAAACALVLATSAEHARAQGKPYLVKDIETRSDGIAVRGAQAVGDVVFFAGNDGVHGFELWRSDGTANGTRLVLDAIPGPRGYVASELTAVGDALFYVYDDGEHGAELWISDGTAAGTHLVRDIAPGPRSSSPRRLTAAHGLLFFVADDGVHGEELWISDGTEAGTALVADVRPGELDSAIQGIVAFGDGVAFTADDGEVGLEPWWSDGTPEGTVLIEDIFPGSKSSIPQELTVLGDMLLFTADDGETGRELWRADAGVTGAVQVADLWLGKTGSRPSRLFTAGGLLYFIAAANEATGFELWTSDGTGRHTLPLIHLAAGPRSVTLQRGIALGDTAYFVLSGTDLGLGASLWKSNGTLESTVLVADLKSFPCSEEFGELVPFGNRLLFVARGPGEDDELWITDGTTEGTTRVKDILPGPGGSKPQHLTVANGRLFFSALDGLHGRELWVSDGTGKGTVLVRDILDGTAPGAGYWRLHALEDRVVFEDAHTQPWLSDGTAEGTVPWSALAGQRAISAASTRSSTYLFTGTEPTRLQGFGYGISWFAARALGDDLYFSASILNRPTLWRATSEPPAVQQLASFTGRDPEGLLRVRDRIYFVASDASHGSELWRTDGTPEGTKVVADVLPGPGGGVHAAGLLGNLGRRVFFAAEDGVHGGELWVTKGTKASTKLVKDIRPGTAGSMTAPKGVRFRKAIYFGADDGIHGSELWRTDGTPEGTTLVADVRPGPEGSHPRVLARLPNGVLFIANHDMHTAAPTKELWVTDGTPEGTVRLVDATASSWLPLDEPPVVIGDVAYIRSSNSQGSTVLWVTDGAPAGTRLAVDVSGGTPFAGIYQVASLRGQLFFIANDGAHGRELWALTCGNGVREAGEQCDDGALNGTPSSCCTGACTVRPELREQCEPIDGELELKRARLQADGRSPAATGQIVIDGFLEASAALPMSVAAGLEATVVDGGALEQVASWPASECRQAPTGVMRCSRRGAVATFKPVAGRSPGMQRYRFSVALRRLAIDGPFEAPIGLRLRSGDVTRAGALEECDPNGSRLRCAP